jgi:hypothetical protein
MNKRKEKEREANGKPRKLVDRSLARKYEAGDASDMLGQNAFFFAPDGCRAGRSESWRIATRAVLNNSHSAVYLHLLSTRKTF